MAGSEPKRVKRGLTDAARAVWQHLDWTQRSDKDLRHRVRSLGRCGRAGCGSEVIMPEPYCSRHGGPRAE